MASHYCLIVLSSVLPVTAAFTPLHVQVDKKLKPECFESNTQLYASSWSNLEKQLGDGFRSPVPISIDSVLQPEKPAFSDERPTLFRERHGWCPYSERVWLALELLQIPYDTIRIDNTGGGKPSYYGGGTTPQMKWPNGQMQGESMDLVYRLDEEYDTYDFQSNNPQVQKVISQFRSIFPSRARPSSRAAFLFQYSGDALWKSTFEDTLQKTDALLANTDGSFFVGDTLTAADIAWAPFLERYRYQLPCLHDGLEPYDATKYPHLEAWYDAMDSIPEYSCHVKGNAASWRKVLFMAGFGNAGQIPSEIRGTVEKLVQKDQEEMNDSSDSLLDRELILWQSYSASRPYLANTPSSQAAQIICGNRKAILADTLKRADNHPDLPDSEEALDETMRDLVEVLLGLEDETSLTNDCRRTVGVLVSFLNERMCVPRDMGSLSAAALERLEWRLRTYN